MNEKIERNRLNSKYYVDLSFIENWIKYNDFMISWEYNLKEKSKEKEETEYTVICRIWRW